MKKTLIVEDDADTLDIMELILRENGYAVIKVNRSISLNEIAAINPELIILDFLLSFGLGTELCSDIKSDERIKHIPIILYSASNDIEQLAIDHGADAYLPKPFDIDNLIQLVSEKVL
ncbi:response regulator [Mucilaginibacter flavus]|uniref:response regulator n=1 Tax=Mucilaginibacter flavus TaxID=931504 RepID=UPI0025B3A62C|nr:response regulator [Mucilaginibacter flavus]MDN3582502.1 response regulator [Mucilaginibacter flavus]